MSFLEVIGPFAYLDLILKVGLRHIAIFSQKGIRIFSIMRCMEQPNEFISLRVSFVCDRYEQLKKVDKIKLVGVPCLLLNL